MGLNIHLQNNVIVLSWLRCYILTSNRGYKYVCAHTVNTLLRISDGGGELLIVVFGTAQSAPVLKDMIRSLHSKVRKPL